MRKLVLITETIDIINTNQITLISYFTPHQVVMRQDHLKFFSMKSVINENLRAGKLEITYEKNFRMEMK